MPTFSESLLGPETARGEPTTKAILVNLPQASFPHAWDVLADCSVAIDSEFADARGAIDGTRLSQSEERLCVVHVASPDQVKELKWLSESFVGRPLLALVDGTSPASLVLAANRAGASQVVAMPLEPADLKAALRALRLRHASPQSVSARRVIAVSGVTGGCGATTIAINLAYEIAHQFELSVILTEFSSLGMIATCLDVGPHRTTHDLLAEIDTTDTATVEKSLSKVTDRLRLLPGPFHRSDPVAPAAGDFVRLIEFLKQLADVVVIDMPMTHPDPFPVLASTDQAVLVAEQAVPALRALGFARERVAEIEMLRQTLLINRYDPNKQAFGVTHLQRLLQTPQLVTIANDYPNVSASLNEGRPLRKQAPGSRTLADINRLATMLISPGQPVPAPAEKSGLWARLRRTLFGSAGA
jgi:pilus assembly protein CpaE